MGDSLCGPSNALQNFQKHSTIDRTLQQDRLIARPSPSQGFRSSPGPKAGLLDPEFEAFQAGQLGYEGHHTHPQFSSPSASFRPQLSQPSTAQSLQQPGPSGWASDFQRLQISSPQPSPFQQSQFHAPRQQRQDTGAWHQDFAQQFQGVAQRDVLQSGQLGGPAFSSQFSPMSGGMGMGANMQQYGGRMTRQAEQSQQQEHPVEAFDDAAFARAFEEASRTELESLEDSARLSGATERLDTESRLGQELSQEQQLEVEQDILFDKSAEQFMSFDQPQILDQAPLGADLIDDHKLHKDDEDPDAMARTAAHLLNTVRDNTSEKFNNSEFFQLMRQFRDRELTVAGDKIVGTNREVIEDGDEAKVQT